jgi:hypothetical protein
VSGDEKDARQDPELRGADGKARVNARPGLLRQLLGKATPYGGFTPSEAAKALSDDEAERASAVVLAADERPGRRFLNPPGGTVDLLLEVMRDSGETYTTRVVVGFSTPERRVRVATAGTRLTVRLHPRDPAKVAIDATGLFDE